MVSFTEGPAMRERPITSTATLFRAWCMAQPVGYHATQDYARRAILHRFTAHKLWRSLFVECPEHWRSAVMRHCHGDLPYFLNDEGESLTAAADQMWKDFERWRKEALDT